LNALSNIGPANTLCNSGTASNLSGGSAVVTQQLATESGGLLYFDNESLRTIDLTSNIVFGFSYSDGNTNMNAIANSSNAGRRVLSGAGSNPGSNPGVTTFGTTYVQSNVLTLGTYQNEIQLVNGYFRGFNQYSYQNYTSYYSPLATPNPNYTSITSGIRWATFSWNIVNDNNKARTAIVSFNDHNFPILTSNLGAGQSFYYFNNVFFYYKVYSAVNQTRTSGWIDGNVWRGSATNFPTPSEFRNYNNIVPGGITAPNTNSNTRSFFIGDTGGKTADTVGRKPFLLYIRLGFPVTCNFYFKNIRLENINQLV
jgi:hypothetical protein